VQAEQDPWLTIEQACEIAGITRRTFERYRERGIGPKVGRIGGAGALRIRKSWLDAWLVEVNE
jgi:predicted DNA-binding transcriptional regulator AlpA